MATINLYKIHSVKREGLIKTLRDNYSEKGNKSVSITTIDTTTGESKENIFEMTLYFDEGTEGKALNWNWVLNAFGHQNITTDGTPKAVILVAFQEYIYAVTFGPSYFRVDQFSDKDWPFDFARRLRYVNIRTTAITNPNSQKNKTINTYLDYENLDLGSGEALTKLKAKIELPSGFNLFSETIEIGNSIKLSTENPSLETLANIILFIEDIIFNEEEKVKIPYFRQVKEPEEIQRLKDLMKQDIENDLMLIDFSEYQIYATKIIFNDNHEFKLVHKYKTKHCDRISLETVLAFLTENNFNVKEDLLDIKVGVWEDGKRIYKTNLEKIIFYTNENSNALLSDGAWYVYNEDYLQYLYDSIYEIPVEYEADYNYSRALHDEYLEHVFLTERNLVEYRDIDEGEVRKRISQKYYKERYYNNWIVSIGAGFANFDRDLDTIKRHKIEVMDLYKDNSMYTVKFGNSSGKLCYAVDQSLEAIKAYHRGDVRIDAKIENVYLWFILERGDLPLMNGVPDGAVPKVPLEQP